MRLLVLTKDLSDNSTGRAHVLWTLATSLGWDCEVIAPTGNEMWHPARGTEFSRHCAVEEDDRKVAELAQSFDLVIAVKPQRGSFGRALGLPRRTPVLVDIDDPDLESILGIGHPIRMVAKAVLRPRQFWPALRMRRRLRHFPTIVSNPVLQRRYGGEIVPHVRCDTGPGAPHTSFSPSIVFVGTNRRHKGIGVLRAAVGELAEKGLRLTITDVAPHDPPSHESWIGQTSLEDGLALVRSGDIVVIPSMPREIHPPAQLPAKLIDAMIAGRAIVVADFEPLRWAIGETGRYFKPGSHSSLVAELDELRDPSERLRLGAAARRRALEMFTIDANKSVFRRACLEAVERGRSG